MGWYRIYRFFAEFEEGKNFELILNFQNLVLLLFVFLIEVRVCDSFDRFNTSVIALFMMLALSGIFFANNIYVLMILFILALLLKVKAFLICRGSL